MNNQENKSKEVMKEKKEEVKKDKRALIFEKRIRVLDIVIKRPWLHKYHLRLIKIGSSLCVCQNNSIWVRVNLRGFEIYNPIIKPELKRFRVFSKNA